MADFTSLRFPISPALAAQWAPAGLSMGNFLVLRVLSTDYTPIYPEAYTVLQGYSSPIVEVRPRRIGFEVLVRDGRDLVWEALETLRQLQEPTASQFTPTMVWDYVRPDLADRVQGYTIRRGQLAVTPLTGTFLKSGTLERLHGGLQIQLLPYS